MDRFDITQKKLLDLYKNNGIYDNEIPLLDGLYVITTRKTHDSGFRCFLVFGYSYDDDFLECLSDCSDVISFEEGIIKMDCKENGLIHYFGRRNTLQVISTFSDFIVNILSYKKRY